MQSWRMSSLRRRIQKSIAKEKESGLPGNPDGSKGERSDQERPSASGTVEWCGCPGPAAETYDCFYTPPSLTGHDHRRFPPYLVLAPVEERLYRPEVPIHPSCVPATTNQDLGRDANTRSAERIMPATFGVLWQPMRAGTVSLQVCL